MAFQILLNVLLAFVWMLLQVSFDGATFVIGYLLGLFILFVFRRFFPSRFYIGRVIAIVHLLLVFLKELVLSNVDVLKLVLKPKLDIQPGIFALPIEVKKDWEITVLANLITLTPGTLVIDVDDGILYVHAVDLPNVEEAIQGIKDSFERLIREVSR
ncbi:Na+/H+ antiporter subunit E [Bacillus fonticola]|uniref:Na+/H+ antiporter subunit E n=1 Tax=Bacillus fonticola TaxID=2728853 RepID=UPI001474447C|nr:Na+/H+ antiporter subunit E [Bacillus fonticola]